MTVLVIVLIIVVLDRSVCRVSVQPADPAAHPHPGGVVGHRRRVEAPLRPHPEPGEHRAGVRGARARRVRGGHRGAHQCARRIEDRGPVGDGRRRGRADRVHASAARGRRELPAAQGVRAVPEPAGAADHDRGQGGVLAALLQRQRARFQHRAADVSHQHLRTDHALPAVRVLRSGRLASARRRRCRSRRRLPRLRRPRPRLQRPPPDRSPGGRADRRRRGPPAVAPARRDGEPDARRYAGPLRHVAPSPRGERGLRRSRDPGDDRARAAVANRARAGRCLARRGDADSVADRWRPHRRLGSALPAQPGVRRARIHGPSDRPPAAHAAVRCPGRRRALLGEVVLGVSDRQRAAQLPVALAGAAVDPVARREPAASARRRSHADDHHLLRLHVALGLRLVLRAGGDVRGALAGAGRGDHHRGRARRRIAHPHRGNRAGRRSRAVGARPAP